METGDIDLLTFLFYVNVSPIQISRIIEQLKGPQTRIFTPKRIQDMNQKADEQQDFALGLLPDSNDAVKTIAKLERYVIARGSGGKMTIFSNGPFDQYKYPDPLIYTPI
jgi:hypothetical protein